MQGSGKAEQGQSFLRLAFSPGELEQAMHGNYLCAEVGPPHLTGRNLFQKPRI
jgi:hypothetical protein